MLVVETYIESSSGKGLGLFAKNKIEKGTIFWIRNEYFDKIISHKDLESLDKLASEHVRKYGILEASGNWYHFSDNTKFINHSLLPNTLDHFNNDGLIEYSTAIIDILEGDEILCDYTKSCLACKNGVAF